METKQINRREFLTWLGISGLSTLEAVRGVKHLIKKNTQQRIYNLRDDVKIAGHYSLIDNKPQVIYGAGVILNGYYISMAHISRSNFTKRVRTLFGIMETPLNPKNRHVKIGDNKLETLVEDKSTDVYIARLDKKIPNFPCKPSNRINYGERVYLIGNPGMAGFNIRQGYISDLDGFGDALGKAEYAFGVDFAFHFGDSGCPLVNDKFELLGLAKYDSFNKFGYVNKIELYLESIKKLK